MQNNREMHYQLLVKKPKELLAYLINSLPTDSIMSFEGDLSTIQETGYTFSTEEQGNLTRNTRTPRQDFRIFKLDERTKEFLTNDFLNRVGIRKNVIHVLVENDDRLIFAAFDNFAPECVSLLKSEVYGKLPQKRDSLKV